MLEVLVLFVERLKLLALECRRLGVLNRILDRPLAVRVSRARRIGDDAVVDCALIVGEFNPGAL